MNKVSLSDDNQTDIIGAVNTTSRYIDGILNIYNVYFDHMDSQIYPSKLELNKAGPSNTGAAFTDLHLSISNDIVSTKISDKRDDFEFASFPFLDLCTVDVHRSTSYVLHSSELLKHPAILLASTRAIHFNSEFSLTRLLVSYTS